MKIIIVGCGRVGQTLAEKLNKDGNDVTENYSIDYSYGNIKVIPRQIHILTDSKEFLYAFGYPVWSTTRNNGK